jgi:hypothetical protein
VALESRSTSAPCANFKKTYSEELKTQGSCSGIVQRSSIAHTTLRNFQVRGTITPGTVYIVATIFYTSSDMSPQNTMYNLPRNCVLNKLRSWSGPCSWR